MSEKTTLGYVCLVWLTVVVVSVVCGALYAAVVNPFVAMMLSYGIVVLLSLLAFARVLEEWF